MEVNDDALRLVLERVGSQDSLIRAAAVCKRWRRAIADPAFLRRFRSLHAPAVAGDYHNGSPLAPLVMGGRGRRRRPGPVFCPASAAVDARRYSLDFLPAGPRGMPWQVVDGRGSLLLLVGTAPGDLLFDLPEMVVCEPLTRRYVRMPRMMDFDAPRCYFLSPHLIDGDTDQAGGRIGLSNFRMVCMIDRDGVAHADLFVATSELGPSWSKRNIDHIMPRMELIHPLGHAAGSWYFYAEGRTLVVLDGSTGDVSSSLLPASENWDSNAWKYNFHVTEGRDGKPRIFTVFDDNMKVYVKLDGGQWALEKRVLLSQATKDLPGYQTAYFILPHIILTRGVGFAIISISQVGGAPPFSIDLETMEPALATEEMGPVLYRCELPWPPALQACLD